MAVDRRAIMYGLGVFLCLHLGYLFLETALARAFVPLVYLFFATPVLAGALTGYLARRRPLASLVVLGVLVALGVSTFHVLWAWLGLRADAGGGEGAARLGLLSLLFALPMVIVGGAVGVAFADAKG